MQTVQRMKASAQGARAACRPRLQAAPRSSVVAAAGVKPQHKVALLFDCDGVIVDTEQLHRRAYCAAFEDFALKIDGVPVVWDVPYYDILQNTVGGGKPKMKYHFNKYGWPSSKVGGVPASDEEKNKLVDMLQDKKTEFYKKIVDEAAEARPGIIDLMEEALANPHVAVAICSAATKEGFVKVVNAVLGPERLARFDLILAGDDVSRKKPDPLIYNLASERLGVPASACVVVEDSLVGLRAAQGANMRCLITPTTSSHEVDFIKEGADAVVPALKGDGWQIHLSDLFDTTDPASIAPRIRAGSKVPANVMA